MVDDHTPPQLLAAADAPPPGPEDGVSTRVPRLRARSVSWERDLLPDLGRPLYAMADVEVLYVLRYSHSMEDVVWPRGLRELYLDLYDLPATSVSWPPSLEQLKFGPSFNQPIEGVSWPRSLQHLKFGSGFNQPIGSVTWPESLRKLEFGKFFTQPIAKVKWPASLQDISIGSRTFPMSTWRRDARQLDCVRRLTAVALGVASPINSDIDFSGEDQDIGSSDEDQDR